MALLLSQVFFQCPGAYLLWKILKWAGGKGRGVWNVYKGIGLDGGWGVGWLEWKLMWCFWVLVTSRDACVTCHTRHTSVTDFRPKLGNPVEVTLMTSPKLYIVSHAKGTTSLSFNINLDTTSLSFPCLRQTQ